MFGTENTDQFSAQIVQIQFSGVLLTSKQEITNGARVMTTTTTKTHSRSNKNMKKYKCKPKKGKTKCHRAKNEQQSNKIIIIIIIRTVQRNIESFREHSTEVASFKRPTNNGIRQSIRFSAYFFFLLFSLESCINGVKNGK